MDVDGGKGFRVRKSRDIQVEGRQGYGLDRSLLPDLAKIYVLVVER